MPEPTTPTAPAATPPSQTPPPVDLTAPPKFVPQSPEDDADHQLKQMISRRRKPAAAPAPEAGAPTQEAPAAPAPPPPAPAEAKPPAEGFNAAVGAVFGWKPEKKKPEAAGAAAPASPEAPAAPPAEPAKTIVGKKKAAPAAPNITEITTAATTAAVRALQGEPKTAAPAAKPEDSLKPEDRHDYEVARVMAETNPKYKDAPRVVLEHVRKSEAYASKWEADNKGKQFDPDDDEHNEFFDSLEKPWSDYEFRAAETEMVAERIAEKTTRKSETKIKALEQDNARLELTPIVQNNFVAAAGYMAEQLQVKDKLAKGFAAFQEEDPITADAIANALGPIQPLIEAIVQIDEPRGRFPVDEKNPAHQAWLQLLTDKEMQFAGVESNDGKMFATRISYARMNDAQRARHWYLTADHLLTEVVNDAVATATERVKTEKEKQTRIARSLGYVLPGDVKPGAAKTVATNGEAGSQPAPAPAGVAKPVSPSVGSGAKIDTKGETVKTGRSALLAAMGDILYRPGNPVP